jgi:short-subunit dehydrogenase
VVTGGSAGIGKAFAQELAGNGYDLLLVARREGPLAGVAREVADDTGRRVETLTLDLTDVDAPKRVLAKAAAGDAYVQLLVNSAGLGLGGRLEEQDPDELNRLVDLNIKALTALTRAVLPDMLKRGDGGIINVASLGGHVPGPNQAAYYASKAYVISLTEALAWEVRGHGVRIAAICPGPARTRFHAAMGAERSYYLPFMGTVEPRRVARAAYWGHRLGLTLVYPRLLDWPVAIALRLMPHFIVIPIVSFLLRRRNGNL